MGTQLNAWHLVSAPPAVPYRFGLFSVATPRTGDLEGVTVDEHWRFGVQWETQACSQAKLTTGSCIDADVAPLDPDDYCQVSKYEPFTVYAFNNSDTIGSTLVEHEANAVARLTNGEQEAAEEHLWGLLTDAVSSDLVDLSGYPLWYGLAWVEQKLAEEYGGQGVIHMSRLTATMLSDQLRVEGGRLFTLLGTPVVSGGGYDKIGDNAPNEAVIYGSGPVVMYRGDIDTRENAVDRANNTMSIVAQRDYVLGWDCVVVGAEVSVATVEEGVS